MQGTNAYKSFEDWAYHFAPHVGLASTVEPYVVKDVVGDKDDFVPGDPLDTPPLSDSAVALLNEIKKSSPTWGDPVALDVSGANRPVALSHRIYPLLNAPIRSATLRFVFDGQEWLKNDLIVFRGPYSAAMTVIIIKDLLGKDPRVGAVYDITVDLSRVPVRVFSGPEDWTPAGSSWSDREGLPEHKRPVLNLLPMLQDGVLDLVFIDDVRLNFSELKVVFGDGSETPAGKNVVSAPYSDSYVQFYEVHNGGFTTLETRNVSSVLLPEKYELGPTPLFYDIKTTALYDGPLTVQLKYDSLQFTEEGRIRLLHEQDGRFVDCTFEVDFEKNWVSGRVASLSEFTIAEFTGPPPSITEGFPKGRFGDGYQTDEVTEPGNWRWSRYFYGVEGIDEIKWESDACGGRYNYAIGWHQSDLGEYLMKFGGDYSTLVLRGKADRPGPVGLNVYVDGVYKITASWDRNNNCNQDVKVHIPGIPYGTHAIAVEFANDYWDGSGRPDGDRNMYLDGLLVSK